MKKKLFAILLALALLLSSMLSLSEVSFAQGENYVLTDSAGVQLLATDDAKTLLNYMNTPSNFDQAKSYTLTLKEDLVIPVDASTSKLKTLEIHCNLTIEGNEKTITGDAGGQEGDRFIRIITEKGNININNLKFDGAVNSSPKYAGILSKIYQKKSKLILNLSSCTFENCTTGNLDWAERTGAGLALHDDTDYIPNESEVILNSCSFIKCSADYGGGAIAVSAKKSLILEDTLISDCHAKLFGGAIYAVCVHNFYLKGVKNSIKSCIENCSTIYEDDQMTYSTGGAIVMMNEVEQGEKLDISNYTIKGCSAKGSGGSIHVFKANCNIKNSKFIGNKVEKECGGAIFVNDGSLKIETGEEKTEFLENEAIYGGAIALMRGSIDIKNTEFKENKAKILVMLIDSVEFKFGGDGAAVYLGPRFLGDSNQPKMLNISEDSIITDNYADKFGGGIYSEKGTVNIDSSTIEKNTALNGGGLYLKGGSAEIKNRSEIRENEARFSIVEEEDSYSGETKEVITGKGAGLYIIPSNNSEYKIYNSKIINNKAGALGGGIYFIGAIYEVDQEELYDETDLYDYLKAIPYYIKLNKATFEGNTAGFGFYNPPKDIESIKTGEYPVSEEDYNTLMSEKNSCKDKLIIKDADGKWQHIESLINNYDIDYINPITTTTYMENFDKNGIYVNQELTTKDYQNQETNEISGHDLKVLSYEKTKLKENPDTTKPFRIWNTEKDGKGTDRKVDAEISGHKGNMTLFAQWGAKPVPPTPAPEPKPTEPNKYILTLDENYRGGEITDHELEEGELIAPYLYIPRRRGYIFKGWSYDRKHLEEVKPEDRIYSDTILYAIWKKAEIEKHEEPEEIRGEDNKAYIFGYPNGTVRPNGNITRAEAAAMLARLLNIEAIGSSAKPNFIDTESSWYNKAINAIVERGIMKGYPDGRFRPNAPITRAEFTQMISTIDNKPYGEAPFVDVKGHWAERAIGSEYQAKRITGYPDGLFRPDANITRAEAAVILNKIFERNYDAMSLAKCKNALMLKRFIDLDETFWGYNDMVEATNTHEYIRRYKGMVQEDWLLIK